MANSKTRQPAKALAQPPASKSMHDGVPVWCDCCSCEAEPYWLEAMESQDDKGWLPELAADS